MTFCRSAPPGTLKNIFVPCAKPVGLARNLSRVASSQVTFAVAIPGEYLYPVAVPLLRPTTPESDGPILFTPGEIE